MTDQAEFRPAREATPPKEWRQVCVLFTDMVGYTSIIERISEEDSLAFTKLTYEYLSSVVTAHGGAVRSFAGDSIMAVFGIPDTLEDAGLHACRAGLAIHAAFEAAGVKFEAQFGVRPVMRVGISSGQAVIASVEGDDAQLTAVGNTVNRASRIQALAPSGGTLICNETKALVNWRVDTTEAGTHVIKGVSQPMDLWSLNAIRSGDTRFDASIAQGLTDYIGRDAELRALFDALEEAEISTQLVDVVAEPGLGKTRLLHEFLERTSPQDRFALNGQCSANGQNSAYYPFLEVLRQAFQIQRKDDVTKVAAKLREGLSRVDLQSEENVALLLNLLGLPAPPGALDGLDGVLIGLRTRDLLPALIVAQSKRKFVLLKLEDVHWIDTASEQLLHQIAAQSGGNVLILTTRRPEYRPVWPKDAHVRTLALRPLAGDDIRRLAQTQLGVTDLPEDLLEQVEERAGGNPLFGEEILSFLRHHGALRVDAGVVDFDAVKGAQALPANLRALLAARIDRLEPEDKFLLQAAAAIGRRFSSEVLSLVVAPEGGVTTTLDRLQELDIVHKDDGPSAFVFKHALLRDSVYEGMMASRKAALHLAIGKAIERLSAERLTEVAEVLAYHFGNSEQKDLAFTYAALAGRKSLGVYSLEEAHQYLSSALALYASDETCATNEAYAALLSDFALCCNLTLNVVELNALIPSIRGFLRTHGDSRHHAHVLHHHISCLVWAGRYSDADPVQAELNEMANRMSTPEVTAYALVSDLALSCYRNHLSSTEFERKRRKAEMLFDEIDDAFLYNFFLANVGWNDVCRGRVPAAKETAAQMVRVGQTTNDPRALGYGTAMKALIALISDDHQTALDIAADADELSRVEFERIIAESAKYGALVPLEGAGAIVALKEYIQRCNDRGLYLFSSTPDAMMGIALAFSGQITDGIERIEAVIKQREHVGYQIAADWYRMFLAELYMEILSGEGEASLGVLLRNLKTIGGTILFGEKRIVALIEQARTNTIFDPNGHQIGRAEMILGLTFKAKKRKEKARHHLQEAHRIIAPSGRSPMLTRIENALSELA